MTDLSARSTFLARHLPKIVVAGIILAIIVITLARGRGTLNQNGEDPAAATQPAPASAAAPSTSHPLRRRPAALDDASLIATRRSGQREKVQEAVDSSQATLASQFQSEKIDAAWAPSKERALIGLSTSDRIKELNADIRNLAVDCKTKLCRITGDFPTISAGDDWFTLYMNNVAAEVPYASYKYVPHQDGSVRIEVYGVARK